MAEDKDIETTEETPEESASEVEAHSSEVLGLQGISVEQGETGLLAGSCSSCAGSLCN